MYVFAEDILTHVGIDPLVATDDELAWANLCADAIEGAITARLDLDVPPDAFGTDELQVAALTDGAALYNSRAAPNGILSMGPDGEAVRMGADSLRAVLPVLRRIHPTAGIALV